jgi:hypothetical protein
MLFVARGTEICTGGTETLFLSLSSFVLLLLARSILRVCADRVMQAGQGRTSRGRSERYRSVSRCQPVKAHSSRMTGRPGRAASGRLRRVCHLCASIGQ